MIERHYSLSQAAKLVGVERHTLKLWLAQTGLVLPAVRRGSKVQVPESAVKRALEKREPHMSLGVVRKAG